MQVPNNRPQSSSSALPAQGICGYASSYAREVDNSRYALICC
jgi:hypothetical protein